MSYKEPGRRKTIHNLAKQNSERRQSFGNLEKQFHRNWQSISIGSMEIVVSCTFYTDLLLATFDVLRSVTSYAQAYHVVCK